MDIPLILASHVIFFAWLWHRSQTNKPSRTNLNSRETLVASNPHLAEIHRLHETVPNLHSTPTLPLPLDATPVLWVDTHEKLIQVVSELQNVSRLAIDTEHHATHTYTGITCLLQLSTGTVDYLIDSIALKASMHLLAPPLESSETLKIVHGGGSDLLWLHRDFGLHVVNIFDTEKACQVLGFQQRALAHLLRVYCSVDADKSHQRADWRQRPLPQPLEEYARSDVHWLLYIADCLGQELLIAERGESESDTAASVPVHGLPYPETLELTSLLARAVHRSQALSLTSYTPPEPGVAATNAAVSILKGHIAEERKTRGLLATFSQEEVEEIELLGGRVYALCQWRDGQAQLFEEGVQCVLPDAALLHLSLVSTLANCPPLTFSKEVKAQIVGFISQNTNKSVVSDSCLFPVVVLQQAGTLAKILQGVYKERRRWVHPDVQAQLRPQTTLESHARRRQEDPVAMKARLGERFGTKKKVYENCRMLSAEGELLCFTDRKRLQWYVAKGLAEEVSTEPYTVRLTFVHRDDDQRAGSQEFYSAPRINRCVACGEGQHYLRYRVVPACYRRALPMEMKSHRSHDVLLLCVSCHELAQAAAEGTKREISVQYNIPLFPNKIGILSSAPHTEEGQEQYDTSEENQTNGKSSLQNHELRGVHPFNVRKAALALQRIKGPLPEGRREELQILVRTYVRSIEPWLYTEYPSDEQTTDKILEAEVWAGLLAGMAPNSRRRSIRRWIKEGHEVPVALIGEVEAADARASGTPLPPSSVSSHNNASTAVIDGMGHGWHGRAVVEAVLAGGGIAELAALCARFRKSFVDALQPKHLPPGWEVNHKAPRIFGEHSIYSASSLA